MFEINKRDGLARLGKIKTKSGVLNTPTLLPVVNPKILTLSMEELKECGAQGIITNSYIIYKNSEIKEIAEKKGVHGLLNWEGPIMTDSGTFQSHVYGEIEMEPDVILDFQKKIGVDIGTVLDVFTEPGTRFEEAKKELDETQKRIEELWQIILNSKKALKNTRIQKNISGNPVSIRFFRRRFIFVFVMF